MCTFCGAEATVGKGSDELRRFEHDHLHGLGAVVPVRERMRVSFTDGTGEERVGEVGEFRGCDN